jgi:urease accessory protein
MKRVCEIKREASWDESRAIDRVVLDAEGRHRRRAVLIGEKGTQFLLDEREPVALHDGDGLVLDDGTIVAVLACAEALVEVSAARASELARLAWHIGNRHTDVEIVGAKLRIRRDHVLEDMLRGLGARLTPVEAPFEPERGAYGHSHTRSHEHSHRREHGVGSHEHVHEQMPHEHE